MFQQEIVEESTHNKLVTLVRPWCRWDWMSAFPGLALGALICLYIGMNIQSYWRFLFYGGAVYCVGSFLLFYFEIAKEVRFIFDEVKGEATLLSLWLTGSAGTLSIVSSLKFLECVSTKRVAVCSLS